MKLEDIILRDTRANQPAFNAVPVGTLYYVTDESVLERSSGSAWESYSGSGAGATAFTDLTDVPSSYVGEGGKVVSVKGDESGLEFTAGGGGSGITELTGDVTAGPGSGSQAATLANTAVTPGTYGDATNSPQITVDSKGRITSVTDVPISGGGGSSDILVLNTTITSAQLNNALSSPIILVTGVANKVIIPIYVAIVMSRDTPYLSSDPFLGIKWVGDSAFLLMNSQLFLSGGGAGVAYRDWDRTTRSLAYGGFDPRNKDLVFEASADTTGGNSNLFLKVSMSYYIGDFA